MRRITKKSVERKNKAGRDRWETREWRGLGETDGKLEVAEWLMGKDSVKNKRQMGRRV